MESCLGWLLHLTNHYGIYVLKAFYFAGVPEVMGESFGYFFYSMNWKTHDNKNWIFKKYNKLWYNLFGDIRFFGAA